MNPLVVVHGFLGGSAQWKTLIPLLIANEIITIDLPGFGLNHKKSPCRSIEQMADYVVDKVYSTHKISNFDLLGHSMGGMIAQEIALKYAPQVARLILLGTGSVGALPGRFESIATSKRRALEDGVVSTAHRICATWYKDQEDSPHYSDCAKIAQRASAEAVQAGLEAMQNWDRSTDIHKIKCDTLIVWGDADRTYSREQVDILHREIAKSEQFILPGAAHAIHDEMPHELSNEINQFLGS